MKIFIDIGHGGLEVGAIAKDGRLEKDLNLVVGMRVRGLLIQNGFDVKCSREMDVDVSLEERCMVANEWGADLFISIHHNAGGGRGFEVIHSLTLGEGKKFADILGSEYLAFNNLRNVYSRESETDKGKDYYYVIRYSNMPSVISEFCFIDTADIKSFNAENEAQCIFRACLRYKGQHWAQSSWDELRAKGVQILEMRFDDKITRGEVFCLLNQIVKR